MKKAIAPKTERDRIATRIEAAFMLIVQRIRIESKGMGISSHIHTKELYEILDEEEKKLLRHLREIREKEKGG